MHIIWPGSYTLRVYAKSLNLISESFCEVVIITVILIYQGENWNSKKGELLVQGYTVNMWPERGKMQISNVILKSQMMWKAVILQLTQ